MKSFADLQELYPSGYPVHPPPATQPIPSPPATSLATSQSPPTVHATAAAPPIPPAFGSATAVPPAPATPTAPAPAIQATPPPPFPPPSAIYAGVPSAGPPLQARPITAEALAEDAGEHLPSLRDALLSTAELVGMPIAPRTRILGLWFREGDFGYIYAPRGHGKTWLAMLIAKSISENSHFGEWTAGESPFRVVYLDAEMNLRDVQDRAKIIGMTSLNVLWLQHERVSEVLKRTLNIASVEDQLAIAAMLEDGDVFIVDNLSTAACGMAENDNDAFDHIKSWLLQLRARKISVIIIHHAGRNGEMRGASRREDMAHWILSLKDDSGDGDSKSWITQFKKLRNCKASEAPPLRWAIETAGGSLTYSCKTHSGPEAMLALIREGVVTSTELADELGRTRGCISKWAKKLQESGKLEIKNRIYVALE